MSKLMTVVSVALEDRTDGGLRAHSEALPGLLLSGPNKKQICEAIAPAIKALFERKGHRIAGVHPERPISEVMQGAGPRHVNMSVMQFVVEYLEAA